jgi:hypothetical protein
VCIGGCIGVSRLSESGVVVPGFSVSSGILAGGAENLFFFF